jgi:hypothetical protein
MRFFVRLCALIVALEVWVGIDMVLEQGVTYAATSTGAAPWADVMASSVLTPTTWTPPDPAYRVPVLADGIYALTYAHLQNAGLPVATLDPRTLRLFYLGREVAIQVLGEEDGHFGPQDLLIFHGRSIDSLYFQGLLAHHKYTNANLYWLTYGGAPGKRVTTKPSQLGSTPSSAFLYTERQEQQFRYITEYPRYKSGPLFNPADDHWFWYRLQIFGAGGSRAQNFTFPVSDLPGRPFTATLTARVVGAHDSLHGLRLRVNNTLVLQDSTSWQAYEPFTAVAAVPSNLLVNGSNTIQVEMFNINSNISENYIDWVALRYPKQYRATADQLAFTGEGVAGSWVYTFTNFTTNTVQIYDVTDLHNVQLITATGISGSGPYTVTLGDSQPARRYWALTPTQRRAPTLIEPVTHLASPYTPSQPVAAASSLTVTWDLLDRRNGADWIVITHRDFWTATLPLAAYRAKTLRVAMVDVQEIYNHFNGGMLASEAIRDFLAYAYTNWTPPAPRYVLLAGGGTNDMRRYLSNSRPTYVPTFIYPADPILGETAADNRFVTLVGGDLLPDMAIGRFPAYTALDINTMVSKTIRYEATPPFSAWSTNVVFLTDDLEGGGGNFYEYSDLLADGSYDPLNPAESKYLPTPYRASKIYLGQTCDLDNPTNATECRAQLTDAINNDGALLVSYIGHAQTANWAVERLLDINLASTLTNTNRLPIFLPMACFEGFFHLAPVGSRSLAEAYLFNPGGGAVASWSPTGFGVATGHDWLEQGFFRALFHEEIHVLGDVVNWAKQFMDRTAPRGKYDDLIDTYHLLGDPALMVQVYVAPTAVALADFSASAQPGGVVVEWRTTTESDLLGFYVLRRRGATDSFAPLQGEPIPAHFPGQSRGAVYRYHDQSVGDDGQYEYKLGVITPGGNRAEYGWAVVDLRPPSDRIFLPTIYVN